MGKPEVPGEVAQQVRRVIEPEVEAAGLYLEGVRLVGAGAGQQVRVTVDLPETEVGSLGSDQLGEVSRAISAALDRDDVVPGQYTLEVSTPGVTRPLHEARQFRRARTRLVRLTLVDGSEMTGRLRAVSPGASADGGAGDIVLTLDVGGQERRVPLEQVKVGQVELEMSRVADARFDDDDDSADSDEFAGDGEEA